MTTPHIRLGFPHDCHATVASHIASLDCEKRNMRCCEVQQARMRSNIAKHCAYPSPIQTILSVLELHQIHRRKHTPARVGSRTDRESESPPVGNFTPPRRI